MRATDYQASQLLMSRQRITCEFLQSSVCGGQKAQSWHQLGHPNDQRLWCEILQRPEVVQPLNIPGSAEANQSSASTDSSILRNADQAETWSRHAVGCQRLDRTVSV